VSDVATDLVDLELREAKRALEKAHAYLVEFERDCHALRLTERANLTVAEQWRISGPLRAARAEIARAIGGEPLPAVSSAGRLLRFKDLLTIPNNTTTPNDNDPKKAS